MKIIDNKLYKSKWFGLKKDGKIKVALCTLSVDGNFTSLSLSSISAYIKKYNKDVEIKLFTMFPSVKDVKYSPEGFSNFLSQWEPDIIALSIMSTHWFVIKPFLTKIKEKNKNIPVVVGGYQAILSTEETLKNKNIDIVCHGDGEIPLSNFIDLLRGNKNGPIQGLLEKRNSTSYFYTQRYQVKKLSEIPYFDYDIFTKKNKLHIANFFFNEKNQVQLPVATGRGCHFSCTFCSNSTLRSLWENKKEFIRRYDVDIIITSLKNLIKKYKVDKFEFWDELFIDNSPFIYNFLLRYKEEINLPFTALGRVEYMKDDLMKLLSEAGCTEISFGVESGDEEYRKKYLKRFMSNDEILEAANNCKKYNIKAFTFNMLGMPYETKENMKKTIDLNSKIDPDYIYFTIYTPLPNTQLYNLCKENDLLINQKKNPFYEYGKNKVKYKLNIKEHEGGINDKDFNDICYQMFNLQQKKYKINFSHFE
jgi:radical SAM superfamily enzyme YgiQ (UPF0313 family)